DTLVLLGIHNLFLTLIGCHHAVEHRCQSDCRLSTSRGAIPRELTTWRDATQINEQLRRVTRSKDRVISRLFRKMIFACHTSLYFAVARLVRRFPSSRSSAALCHSERKSRNRASGASDLDG